MATVVERVRAGATFLDSRIVGWAEQVRIDLLNMSDCAGCVIGQTFDGDYRNGINKLELTDEDEIALGFEHSGILERWSSLPTAEMKAKWVGAHAEYAALKAAWLSEIALRLGTPEAEEARIEAQPVDTCEVWGAL